MILALQYLSTFLRTCWCDHKERFLNHKTIFPEWPNSKLVPWHPHLQHVVKWHYMVFPNIKWKRAQVQPVLLRQLWTHPSISSLWSHNCLPSLFFILFHFTTALESNINPCVSSKPLRARRRGKVTADTISHPVELRLSPAPSRVHSGACVCHPQTSAEGVTTLPNPTSPLSRLVPHRHATITKRASSLLVNSCQSWACIASGLSVFHEVILWNPHSASFFFSLIFRGGDTMEEPKL